MALTGVLGNPRSVELLGLLHVGKETRSGERGPGLER